MDYICEIMECVPVRAEMMYDEALNIPKNQLYRFRHKDLENSAQFPETPTTPENALVSKKKNIRLYIAEGVFPMERFCSYLTEAWHFRNVLRPIL